MENTKKAIDKILSTPAKPAVPPNHYSDIFNIEDQLEAEEWIADYIFNHIRSDAGERFVPEQKAGLASAHILAEMLHIFRPDLFLVTDHRFHPHHNGGDRCAHFTPTSEYLFGDYCEQPRSNHVADYIAPLTEVL